MTKLKQEQFIKHLSYSAIRTFMTSPAKFWKAYVIRDRFEGNLTMVAGQAWHKGLELKFKGEKKWQAHGLQYLIDKAEDIESITEDDLVKELERMEINFGTYAQIELPFEPTEYVEHFVTVASPVEGGLPIKCGIDLITTDGGVTDHKYVKRFDGKPEQFYYIQAWFCYHSVFAITGKYPDFFRISEFKKVKNRDGSPQLKNKVIIYDDKWLDRVGQWYADVTKQILGQKAFMPNPFQIFGGEDWIEYLN